MMYHFITYIAPTTRCTLYILPSPACNVQIINIADIIEPNGQILDKTNYYGMSGGWFYQKQLMFNGHSISYALPLTLAVQDGIIQETNFVNFNPRCNVPEKRVGNCLIYCEGGFVQYAEGVQDIRDNRIPKLKKTWAQSGVGLFLGDVDWKRKFEQQFKQGYVPMNHLNHTCKTAMVMNCHTNMVYLIACFLGVNLDVFRTAILSFIGIHDGRTSLTWRGILLGGGHTAQLRGPGFFAHTPFVGRVPQMISVGEAS